MIWDEIKRYTILDDIEDYIKEHHERNMKWLHQIRESQAYLDSAKIPFMNDGELINAIEQTAITLDDVVYCDRPYWWVAWFYQDDLYK